MFNIVPIRLYPKNHNNSALIVLGAFQSKMTKSDTKIKGTGLPIYGTSPATVFDLLVELFSRQIIYCGLEKTAE